MCPRAPPPSPGNARHPPGRKAAEDKSREPSSTRMIRHQPAIVQQQQRQLHLQQKKHQQTRTKWLPIATPVSTKATTSRPVRIVRRAYMRLPSNDYVPRGCQNCGMSFIPGECPYGREFCSGECRHSFVYRRHMEKKRNMGAKTKF